MATRFLLLVLTLAAAGSQGAGSRPAGFAMPQILGATPDPLAEPRPASHPTPQAAALAIRIAYKGAPGPASESQRSREEARTLAGALVVAARASGADFAALARAWSDDASALLGGFLGTIHAKKDQSAVERAVLQTSVGSVLGPMEAMGGFWVVKRVPLEAIAYDAILVSFAGAAGAPKGVTRGLEEAKQRADDLAARLRANPTLFDELAASENDDPQAAERKGAVAPVFRGDLVEGLEGALWPLDTGGIAGPIETKSGFLLVRRAPVDWVTFEAVVVQFRGADGAPLTQVRSREEAEERARAILDEARKADANFPELIARNTDVAGARGEGAHRTFPVGRGSPAWLRAVAKLGLQKVGEPAEGAPNCGIVPAPFGILVVRRLPRDDP